MSRTWISKTPQFETEKEQWDRVITPLPVQSLPNFSMKQDGAIRQHVFVEGGRVVETSRLGVLVTRGDTFTTNADRRPGETDRGHWDRVITPLPAEKPPEPRWCVVISDVRFGKVAHVEGPHFRGDAEVSASRIRRELFDEPNDGYWLIEVVRMLAPGEPE